MPSLSAPTVPQSPSVPTVLLGLLFLCAHWPCAHCLSVPTCLSAPTVPLFLLTLCPLSFYTYCLSVPTDPVFIDTMCPRSLCVHGPSVLIIILIIKQFISTYTRSFLFHFSRTRCTYRCYTWGNPQLHMQANDTAFSVSAPTYDLVAFKLNKILARLYTWCYENYLTPHPTGAGLMWSGTFSNLESIHDRAEKIIAEGG